MGMKLETGASERFINVSEMNKEVERGAAFVDQLYNDVTMDAGVKGWVYCAEAAIQVDAIEAKAAEIRKNADVFVLVGVGGSNQAARALIEALQVAGGPHIVYAGNTLSAAYLKRILDGLDGKSVYLNVIAKNFETLEPGSHYRVLRAYMEKRYSSQELAARVVLTGTRGTRLEEIARERGHLFLEFPVKVGGRYTAFTPVGLLPIAVAGLDVDEYIRGGEDMERLLSATPASNPALRYAALRNILFRKGFLIETLASFEPSLSYFNRWWWQLFGESEGKDGTGIFPSFAQYSEDLHSIGQYMQSGQRIIMETFLSVAEPGVSVVVPSDPAADDRFDYLDGKDFVDINHAAERATLEAHLAGGIPCTVISVDRLDEYHFGQLFYFFMVACAVSGKMLGVNPFDQEGVEHYKRSMFKALGK